MALLPLQRKSWWTCCSTGKTARRTVLVADASRGSTLRSWRSQLRPNASHGAPVVRRNVCYRESWVREGGEEGELCKGTIWLEETQMQIETEISQRSSILRVWSHPQFVRFCPNSLTLHLFMFCSSAPRYFLQGPSSLSSFHFISRPTEYEFWVASTCSWDAWHSFSVNTSHLFPKLKQMELTTFPDKS